MSTETASLLWSVLVEASLRAMGAAALAAIVLAVTRTRAPGVCHAVWASIACAMLVMPVLPHAVPPVRVAAVPAAVVWPAASTEAINVPAAAAYSAPAPVAAGLAAKSPSIEGRVAPASPRRSVSWVTVSAYLYLAGVLGSLLYISAGWLAMVAIVRRSRPITLPDGSVVNESSGVAAPLTAGLFRPRIILPGNWRDWSPETLLAVIAHERTHIRRHDPLFALAARVNRAVFWFHPLAWWLEAKLASAAEFACDETASRSCRAPAAYAQVLVQIADDVRRNGGRLAWQGIAVSGNGQLKDRIDRLLSGTPWPVTSQVRKVMVACSCVVAVAIAAACRPSDPAAELQPDPTITQQLAEQRARAARDRAARAMSPEQVAELEATLRRTPSDLAAREKLLVYYSDARRRLDADAIAARRAHVLWTIEHQPHGELAGSWGVRLFTTNEDPNPDREGYEQAKRLWRTAMAQTGAATSTFVNAARFFEVSDKPLAEAAWLKAREREPGKWSGELGRLYALVIRGSDASMPLGVVRHVSTEQATSSYAAEVRRKLDASTDPVLLTSAGRMLMSRPAEPGDVDTRALGVKYVERALALDPGAASATAILEAFRLQERTQRVLTRFKGVAPDAMPQAIAALPESERLDVLWRLMSDAYHSGENLMNKKDTTGARAAWQRLTTYAQDALAIGPRHPEHPGAAAAMFDAHVHLGTVALWNGDGRSALGHLEAAPAAAGAKPLKLTGGIGSSRLVRYLLEAGEHEAVANYYERMAKISASERRHLEEYAQALRAGKMPSWYQRVSAQSSAR